MCGVMEENRARIQDPLVSRATPPGHEGHGTPLCLSHCFCKLAELLSYQIGRNK